MESFCYGWIEIDICSWNKVTVDFARLHNLASHLRAERPFPKKDIPRRCQRFDLLVTSPLD